MCKRKQIFVCAYKRFIEIAPFSVLLRSSFIWFGETGEIEQINNFHRDGYDKIERLFFYLDKSKQVLTHECV